MGETLGEDDIASLLSTSFTRTARSGLVDSCVMWGFSSDQCRIVLPNEGTILTWTGPVFGERFLVLVASTCEAKDLTLVILILFSLAHLVNVTS